MYVKIVLFLSFVALSSACQDTTPGCAEAAAGCYSTDPTYLAWIRQKCPKTCNCCGSTNACTDSGTYDCNQTVNGINFCNNGNIPRSVKVENCGRTCNLC